MFVNKNSKTLDISTAPKNVMWNHDLYTELQKRVEKEKAEEKAKLEAEARCKAELEEKDRLFAQKLIEEEEAHYKAIQEQRQRQLQLGVDIFY